MKDVLKVILALLPLVKDLIRSVRKTKDKNEKQEIIKTLRDRDLDKLRRLILD